MKVDSEDKLFMELRRVPVDETYPKVYNWMQDWQSKNPCSPLENWDEFCKARDTFMQTIGWKNYDEFVRRKLIQDSKKNTIYGNG